MNFPDETVRILAQRMYGADPAETCDRASLETTLVPMIRVALRTGHGQPVLLRWLERTLPALAPASGADHDADPDWAAPRMARLLCARMLEYIRMEHTGAASRETIVGL